MRDHVATITTERLVLRPPEPADAEFVYDLTSDPAATEHNPSDRLSSPAKADELTRRWQAQWSAHGIGYWCVADADGLVGVCGLKDVEFRGAPALNLLYRLRPSAWGRGYATEAVQAVLGWAAEHAPDRPVIARVRPANRASQRIAEKVGLVRRPEWDTDGEDGPDLIFSG
jgi:ribosomal-protein-alanine N-acetyltransferase